jgi:hypothetical protein
LFNLKHFNVLFAICQLLQEVSVKNKKIQIPISGVLDFSTAIAAPRIMNIPGDAGAISIAQRRASAAPVGTNVTFVRINWHHFKKARNVTLTGKAFQE